jgi:hypothetical protein
MRCVAPPISLSNSPLAAILATLFIVGAILWIVGAMVVRKADAWSNVELRVDMVERLMLVGQPWCVDDLVRMRESDEDARVREAADAALTVITARRPGFS